MDAEGVIVDEERAPTDISAEEMIKLYEDMLTGGFLKFSLLGRPDCSLGRGGEDWRRETND